MKFFISFFCLIFFTSTSFAQFVTDIAVSGLNSGARFGYAVDISGNTAMIGASNNISSGVSNGSVHFIEKEASGWVETGFVFPADLTKYTGFAESVAISGQHAVVGARYDDATGTNAGAAYFISKTNGGWIQTQKVYSANTQDYGNFGMKVALCQNWAAISAPFEDTDGLVDAGIIYIFKNSDGKWVLTQTLIAHDKSLTDNFGTALAISNNFLAVGSTGDDDKGSGSGSVYIYQRDEYQWKFKTKITASDGDLSDRFGHSVAISEKKIVVGAPYDDDKGSSSGSVYLFDLDQKDVPQLDKITAFDGQNNASFGFDVDMSDNKVIVGSPFARVENFTATGLAYYYKIKNGSFILQKKLETEEPGNYFNFGESVAIDGTYFLVCEPDKTHSMNTNYFGSAYVYDGSFYAPIISSASDVPNDEGGYITINWEASLLDNAAHELTHYSIWRSLTGGVFLKDGAQLAEHAAGKKYRFAEVNGVLGAFEYIGEQQAHFLQEYLITAPTSNDLTDNWFMVSYHTSDPTVFYDSQPVAAMSEDNLAPPPPLAVNTSILDNVIEIIWEISEISDLKEYRVYRAIAQAEQELYATVKERHFTDTDVSMGNEYHYAISAVDSSGNESETAASESVVFSVTALEDSETRPWNFALKQNYPNPFNPSTTIAFNLPQAQQVRIDIFDAGGKLVNELVNSMYSSGKYHITWQAQNLSSGVYYIKMTAGEFSAVKKAVLMK